MRYIHRALEQHLLDAMEAFPAVVLTGPRRAGKTRLLRQLLPEADYHLLEDPDVVARLRADPQGFLDEVETPVILDEIQNVPEILSHVRARIDRNPRSRGQWLLTGSQEAPLMQGVTESMAGRAAILQLLPLSHRESPKVDLLRGGYPEVLARPSDARLWFASYVQTYLERDVRSMTAVRDLATFRRFLALLATRHGQVLNRSELAASLGLSIPTISQWLGILETTGQVLLVPPFFQNAGKRLIKSPKVYLGDSGLACHLLGIETPSELGKSPFRGALFEGFIASEIAKSQINAGRRRELYYFRDQQGLEVDFLVPRAGGTLWLVECKASKTPNPRMAVPMQRLVEAFHGGSEPRQETRCILVHEAPNAGVTTRSLAPGVRALPWKEFLATL